MRILLVDNYDSFVYNLYQYLGELSDKVVVVRNDRFEPSEKFILSFDAIVISPGPGRPEDAGFCVPLVREYAGKIPILGVCLGHQVIAYAFGGKIVRAKRIMHGKTSQIKHDGKTIFEGVANPTVGTRYHSLAVSPDSLPPDFEVSAVAEDGEVMAIRHKKFPLEGIQFHPESVMTPEGKKILKNFIQIAKNFRR